MTSPLPYEDPQFPCSPIEYQWYRPLEFLQQPVVFKFVSPESVI